MRPLEVLIVGQGACGHLGLGTLQVAMAARARQLEPRGTPWQDTLGQEAALALTAAIPIEAPRAERLVALTARALREAGATKKAPLPLFLGVPPRERDADQPTGRALLEAIADATEGAVDLRRSKAIEGTHTIFARVLLEAREALEPGAEILVGAVDSPASQAAIRWLDERGWLCRDDSDKGRVPAEAAACFRLAKRARRKADASFGAIRFVDTEVANPTRGRAPVRIMERMAFLAPAGQAWLLPDCNGEAERSVAWVPAEQAAAEVLTDLAVDAFAELTGDVGAATGAQQLALALAFASTGASRARSALLLQHGDEDDAAGVLVELPPPSGPFGASLGAARDHVLAPPPGSLRPTAVELAHLDRIARGCLEDVGSMGLLLAPEPIEGEGSPEQFGQRLLDAFDAFAALGIGGRGVTYHPDLPGTLQRYVSEAPDRARRFTGAFVGAHLASGAPAPGAKVRRGKRG